MRGVFLAETLFISMAHARVVIVALLKDYSEEKQNWSLGYPTRAAFAAKLEEHWPASTAPMSKTTVRF